MRNLFKKVVALGLGIGIAIASASIANAAVFYDSETGRFISTCESDGTLAFGCMSLFNDYDAAFLATFPEGWRYLQNMVPTTAVESVASLQQNVGVEMSSHARDTSHEMTNFTRDAANLQVYTYTPENPFLVVSINDNSGIRSHSAETFNIEVRNALSGDVVARGYNLNADNTYKVVTDLKNVPLLVSFSNNYNTQLDVSMGSSNSREAEERDYDLSDLPIFAPMLQTSNLPRNINGNQCIIVATRTLGQMGAPNGHRRIRVRFMAYTNGMNTVNINLHQNGECQFNSVQNMRTTHVGHPTLPITHNVVVDILMSTNSPSQGQATIEIASTL